MTASPADQRHIDRAAEGQRLILLALREDHGIDGSMTLDGLARSVTALGLPANSNDVQVWAAMLAKSGKITAVSRTGPVRYALAVADGPVGVDGLWADGTSP